MTQLTHRRQTADLRNGHILFAESGNDHYGVHVWALNSDLPAVTDEVVAFAADYYSVDEDEARELVDPSDIVDSAGAWDDEQFASDLWQHFEGLGRETEAIGWRTQDGAVVLDHAAVEMTYSA